MEPGGTPARSYTCEFPMSHHGCYGRCVSHLGPASSTFSWTAPVSIQSLDGISFPKVWKDGERGFYSF